MNNITIGRYKLAASNVNESAPTVGEKFDGWIEGIRDDGSRWIMWLDSTGNPTVFWATRDPDGGVDGEPINLSAAIELRQ